MQPKETDSGAGTGVSREEKAGPLPSFPGAVEGQGLEPGVALISLGTWAPVGTTLGSHPRPQKLLHRAGSQAREGQGVLRFPG